MPIWTSASSAFDWTRNGYTMILDTTAPFPTSATETTLWMRIMMEIFVSNVVRRGGVGDTIQLTTSALKLTYNSPGTIAAEGNSGGAGSNISMSIAGGFAVGLWHQAAFAAKANDCALSVNASAIVTDVTNTFPGGTGLLTRIAVPSFNATGYTKTKGIVVVTRRVPNAKLPAWSRRAE